MSNVVRSASLFTMNAVLSTQCIELYAMIKIKHCFHKAIYYFLSTLTFCHWCLVFNWPYLHFLAPLPCVCISVSNCQELKRKTLGTIWSTLQGAVRFTNNIWKYLDYHYQILRTSCLSSPHPVIIFEKWWKNLTKWVKLKFDFMKKINTKIITYSWITSGYFASWNLLMCSFKPQESQILSLQSLHSYFGPSVWNCSCFLLYLAVVKDLSQKLQKNILSNGVSMLHLELL